MPGEASNICTEEKSGERQVGRPWGEVREAAAKERSCGVLAGATAGLSRRKENAQAELSLGAPASLGEMPILKLFLNYFIQEGGEDRQGTELSPESLNLPAQPPQQDRTEVRG